MLTVNLTWSSHFYLRATITVMRGQKSGLFIRRDSVEWRRCWNVVSRKPQSTAGINATSKTPAVQSLLHKVKDGPPEDERGEWSLLCVSVTRYDAFFRKQRQRHGCRLEGGHLTHAWWCLRCLMGQCRFKQIFCNCVQVQTGFGQLSV